MNEFDDEFELDFEDTVSTYDADVDLIELLHNATILDFDEDGNEVPGYIFAKDISDMLGISETTLTEFAHKNNYDIFNVEIVGEETPSEMYVICAKGFDQETLLNDYKEMYDLDIKLAPVTSFDDSDDNKKELTEKLTNESIKSAIDWLNSIYFGLEDTKDDDNWYFSCWSHEAHFGPSWPSGQSVMAIQIDNDVEHIHIGWGDIETSEEFDYAVRKLKDKLRKKTDEKNDANIKRESLKDDKKELNYLLRKEKVASLDKEERLRLTFLIQKYGRPNNGLDEAIEDKTSDEIKDRIDSIIKKQIPEVESRITKYKEEQSKTKDEKVIRTLHNKIKDAEKQIKELQKRKETLEIEFETKQEQEKKKNREELEKKLKNKISPGKGKILKDKPEISITDEEKKSYGDNFIEFLKDNITSLIIKVSPKRELLLRRLLPELKENQYSVIEGKTSGNFDMQWGISARLKVQNIESCPEVYREEYFKNGDVITETYKIISILKTNFEELESKISLPKNKELEESNELETRAKRHKRTDKKGARGWFVNYNAGNVTQNITRANHMMGDGSASSSTTVGSAPAGLGEDISLDEMLPHKDETKTDFVARFMSDDKMIKEYNNPKQRYAVALSYWEKK